MAEHNSGLDGPQEPARGARRLLIVEDEVMVAWALVETVHELGWKVCETVTTQQAAIEAASRLKPDAILMDYRLADGGDGLLRTVSSRVRRAVSR